MWKVIILHSVSSVLSLVVGMETSVVMPLWPILSFVLLMSSNMNLFIDYLFIIFRFLFFSASDGHLLNKVNVKVLCFLQF